MTALTTNATPKFTDVENLNRPKLLSKKELLTTVEMTYEATQNLFSLGGLAALSKMMDDAFVAYAESDAFLSQQPTPNDYAALMEKVFEMQRFLRQMYAVDNRVFKKAKKRFYKKAQELV